MPKAFSHHNLPEEPYKTVPKRSHMAWTTPDQKSKLESGEIVHHHTYVSQKTGLNLDDILHYSFS